MGPWGPVAPAAPAGPVGPVGPAAPAGPAAPVDPAPPTVFTERFAVWIGIVRPAVESNIRSVTTSPAESCRIPLTEKFASVVLKVV